MDTVQEATKVIAITIAAAQSISVPLDVAANVQEHLRLVDAAAEHGVQWLVLDTNHPTHAASAAQAGANVYAAGILTSENGYAAEAPLWQSYAREHGMVVLIANHGGPSGGYVSAGRSGIWDWNGNLMAQASGIRPYLGTASIGVSVKTSSVKKQFWCSY